MGPRNSATGGNESAGVELGTSQESEVHQHGGAYSQARRLDQADEEIRDAIALLLDVPEDSFDVTIEPDLGASTEEVVHQRVAQILADS